MDSLGRDVPWGATGFPGGAGVGGGGGGLQLKIKITAKKSSLCFLLSLLHSNDNGRNHKWLAIYDGLQVSAAQSDHANTLQKQTVNMKDYQIPVANPGCYHLPCTRIPDP